MVEAWADVLEDVSVDDARWALKEHYKVSRDSIMPADIVELVEARNPLRDASWAGNVTEQRLAAEAAGERPALTSGDDEEEDGE